MSHVAPIAVVIPTHERVALFERTLKSVLACESPERRSVRLIVVENGRRCGVEAVVRTHRSWLTPEYHYVEASNKSAALNAATEDLGDSLAVFLDDDVRVAPDLLCRYADAADNNPSGCFFGGPFAADYVKPPPPWLSPYLPASAKGWEPKVYQPIRKGLLWFIGFNWAAYNADLKRAGGFDPDVGPGALSGATGQETAMQQALVENGVEPVYVPEARVWHYVPEERCSPEWALDRAFKNGVSLGLKTTVGSPKDQVFGVPRWMIRRRVELGWESLKAGFSRDKKRTFRSRYDLAWFRGQMTGARRRLGSE
jgi:GT2 family glycosyltransferase